jgi:outer membrane protein assembly factor BamB
MHCHKERRNKKKMNKNKISVAIALFLTLTIASTLMTVPNANAASYPDYAYITVSPNPVGVNQATLVVAWLDRLPLIYPNGTETSWENLSIEITTPTGDKETIGNINTDPIGSTFRSYTPKQVGTYTFQLSFPGQTGIDGNYYEPATSNEFKLVVQEEPIPGWTPAPLPTDYWERPIYGENREWSAIGGNWYGIPVTFGSGATSSGGFNPYTTAPETGHVVWTKESAWGGIVGGELGDIAYYTGLSYEGKFGPPIIMQGKLFYNVPLSNQGSSGGAVCVDLRTGEELWHQPIRLTLGEIYNYDSPNQHGAIPYLWQTGSTYRMYDPVTGDLLLTLENVTSGRSRITNGPNGELLVYVLNAATQQLAMWNSSYAPYMLLGTIGTSAWQWRPPIGTTQDWTKGIQWNVTVPALPSNTNFACIGEGTLIAAGTADPNTITAVGFDTTTGDLKWTTNITSNAAVRPNYFIVPIGDGIFTFFKQETREFYGYSIETGKLVWGPTEPYDSPWGMFTSSTNGLGASNPQIAYGTLYAGAYDGVMHAFNVTNGEKLWEYSTGNSGLETPYGAYPFGSGTFAIADDKLYVATGEHSPNSPMWRGGALHAIDAHTGIGVWNLSGWWQNPAIADGYLAAFNNYDSRVYCIGKGPTATSVSIQNDIITLGNSVLVKGMVSDESPGAKESAQVARFANGVPAIADKDMSPWMEYLYMQQPKPTDINGVQVVISVLDSNNNFYEVGKTTSDANGFYKMTFEPPVPGEYTVIASFEGSESYWGSHAETAIDVSEAPAATPEPTPTPASIADMYFVPAIIGIIIAIIVVGAVIVLMLRKR